MHHFIRSYDKLKQYLMIDTGCYKIKYREFRIWYHCVFRIL